MENKRILVIGGTGYIGTCLVRKLIESNFDVTLLIRKGPLPDEFHFCNYIIADLLDKQSLTNNIHEFDLVINMASVIRTTNKKKYIENIEGLKNLIDVLENKRIEKLIYFSTQNVNLKNKGYYSKSKEICEMLLIDSNLNYLIIRPNYVYGIDKNNYFFKMALIISNFHIAPIIGDGNYKIQPILKEDLVNIVMKCIHNYKNHSIIDISGNETISINGIIDLMGKYCKMNPLKLHIPLKILTLFKWIIPFDIEGFTEDKISKLPYEECNLSSFSGNIEKILILANKK